MFVSHLKKLKIYSIQLFFTMDAQEFTIYQFDVGYEKSPLQVCDSISTIKTPLRIAYLPLTFENTISRKPCHVHARMSYFFSPLILKFFTKENNRTIIQSMNGHLDPPCSNSHPILIKRELTFLKSSRTFKDAFKCAQRKRT